MKILAIDQSTTKTGWSIYNYKTKKLLKSGLIDLKTKDVDLRINEMINKVKEIIEKEKIIAVAYEETGKIKGITTAIKLGRLIGGIQYMLSQKQILHTAININSHKSQFGIISRTRDQQKREAVKLVKMLYKLILQALIIQLLVEVL
jgi:Holliday junction resolvasome RuvABC endonuclease subunit